MVLRLHNFTYMYLCLDLLIDLPNFFLTETDALIADVEKNAVWLSKQYKHKSNEKKRPGKEILYSDLFGMEGSFRQLTVD